MNAGFHRRIWPVAGVAVLLSALLFPAAGLAGNVDHLPAKGTQTVFVELTATPAAEIQISDQARQVISVQREQSSFLEAAKKAGIKFSERFAYNKLFNGVSVTVPVADLPKLARLPGVQNLYPVTTLDLPELHTSTEMIHAPEVVADGYDGTGVKIGLIDTGIDYTHPDLGGCFGTGCRVAKGWDFVGDNYMGPESSVPAPDPDPMDQEGHGTHVAGIIGAKAASPQGVTGVAPGVTFYAYKVFGPEGATSDDVILAALEAAFEDHVDVINMSLGSAFEWPSSPTAKAADRLVNRGIVVSTSAGNSGANGLFSMGAPAVGSKVLGVASFDNTAITVKKATLSDGSEAGYDKMTFSPDLAGQSYQIVAIPNLGNSDSDYAGLDLTGKIALISRGSATFASKVARAMSHGAAAAIVHNNVTGFFAGTLGTPDNAGTPWIPTASMSKEDGLRLRGMVAAGPVSITFSAEAKSIPNPTANQISSFSSWGPSPDLDLKPDLGAPGGMIYSTFPVSQGSYASLSGTSMAAPHVTGAAALIIQAHPQMRAAQIQDLLRNTASPKTYGATPYLWPVNAQGAGMIDVRAAVGSPARIAPSKLTLGEFESDTAKTQTVTLYNMTRRAVTYNISHSPALSSYADYPNAQTVKLSQLAASVTTNVSQVTLPPWGMATVSATIAPPAGGFTGLIFGGYLTFTPTDNGPALSVPYLGYQGDYQAFGTLSYNYYDLPWLASLQGGNFYRMDNMTLNPVNGEQAYVLVNLARNASRLRLTARPARGFGLANQVIDIRDVGRGSDPGDFMALSWDGRNRGGAMVPQGDYVLVLEVLRPLGNPLNPADWDRWTSGPISVRYR